MSSRFSPVTKPRFVASQNGPRMIRDLDCFPCLPVILDLCGSYWYSNLSGVSSSPRTLFAFRVFSHTNSSMPDRGPSAGGSSPNVKQSSHAPSTHKPSQCSSPSRRERPTGYLYLRPNPSSRLLMSNSSKFDLTSELVLSVRARRALYCPPSFAEPRRLHLSTPPLDFRLDTPLTFSLPFDLSLT